MRLMIVLLVITCHLSAKTFSQTVTIQQENISLQQALLEIKKQTGYSFIADGKQMESTRLPVLQLKNATLKEALDACLLNLPYTYTITDRLIIIKRKKEAAASVNFITPLFAPPLRGRVTDSTGAPLPGVSIRVTGNAMGTVTNEKGEFTLANVREGAVLLIGSVGFESVRVKPEGRAFLDIVLKRQTSTLESVSVVSTGYQTISRERATGSYDVISKSQLDKPAINIAQRLIGATAGMQAKLDVDGNPTFEIRGKTSLYANASPLVVVDGFAVQGDFNTINPNDVESITILKDAAAASIWGARSANGVIVVTTKKSGKNTPLKVEFSAFTRVGSKFDLGYVNPLATSAETVEYEKKTFNRWGSLTNSGSVMDVQRQWSQASTALSENYLGKLSDADRDATLERLKTQDNRAQISRYLLANPVDQQYNLTLYGGSQRMGNVLSLMFGKNQSNFKGTDQQNYLLNYRTNANVFRWLDFNAGLMLAYKDARNNGVSLGDIQGLSPYDMLVNPDGSYTDINQYYRPILERLVPMNKFPYADWTYNPIPEINNRNITAQQLNMRVQGGLTFKLMKGLSVDSRVQYELFNTTNRGLYNDQTFYVRSTVNQAASWNQTTNAITPNLSKGSILTQSRSKVESYNVRNQINFNRRFGKHEINMIAGSELTNMVSQTFGNPTTYGYNDQTLTLGIFPNGPGGTFKPITDWMGNNQTFGYSNSFSYKTERYFSLYGNASYTYNNKYTLSGSYRTDASNLITDDPRYRFAPFWSAGLAWRLKEESFLANTRWIDQLSLRVTYGYNGNVDKSTAFRPLISMGGTPDVVTQDFKASISSYGNPTLRWEKTGTWNLGADYSFFRDRLHGKVDVYNKNGRDLIAVLSIPAVNGTTSQKLNNASMNNRGIELTVGTTVNISNDNIVWRGDVNFAYNRNRITKLFVANYPASTLTSGGSGAYVEGKDANTLWSFDYAGVFDRQPYVKGAKGTKYDFTGWTPGDGRDYMLAMGTRVAPYTLGMVNTFKIYDVDVSFIITGKFGHVFNRMSFNYPVLWGGRVLPNNKLNEVSQGDPMKVVPLPMNDDEPRFYFWDRFYPYLSYLVENASHIRMQELNVTYNLKRRFARTLHIGGLQVYAQGNDLFTILANHAGEDPEYPLGTMKPMPKFTFGLKLTL
ncbi:SusC/RagA family TonB-linked outer membrane protein [Chitinophaga qingshengii]|uniref:SusC/RagA family TonB-linked outer membrane protein n=1 Tax=Chitinophaga qingshengii TaxID=1569794 RepID=A0ABR7TVL6_9BACT|nr:SusC/RagA family TonB-linked outer membrane protein [Chitinophaga qingshengii]MBC9933024.1 SusC/RagA family TonB-linked outer membrane protein [Chitinophaga qingshengii]